jgi:hypothetical protein
MSRAIRAFIGVLGAGVLATAGAVAAQAPPRPAAPPQQTITGCLQKSSSGAYMLANAVDAKASGAEKKNYMLTGVVPGLKLGEYMQKRIEVVGSIGDPTSVDPKTPTLIMQAVKAASGSCS